VRHRHLPLVRDPAGAGAAVAPEASNASFILACLDGPCVHADTVDWKNAP
jgi:hypothetical protein